MPSVNSEAGPLPPVFGSSCLERGPEQAWEREQVALAVSTERQIPTFSYESAGAVYRKSGESRDSVAAGQGYVSC